MTRHKRTHPYQRRMEWIHSDVVLLGRCGKCGSEYPMVARDYRKKICKNCLDKESVLRKLSWVDRTHEVSMATYGIEDLDEALGWDERNDNRA